MPFIIAFNMGNVFGKARQIPQALKAYQAALDHGTTRA